MRPANNNPLRARGFMILDAIIGIAILGAIMLIIAIAIQRERRAGDRLSQSRHAVRAAEAVLSQLQAGRQMPCDPQGAAVQLHDVAAGAPHGYHWVEVQATAGDQHAALVGLAPAAAAGKGTP